MVKVSLADRTGKKPEDWGVKRGTITGVFSTYYPGMSVEDLLLRPREAIRFCSEVRHMAYNIEAIDCPDDMILRSLKNDLG